MKRTQLLLFILLFAAAAAVFFCACADRRSDVPEASESADDPGGSDTAGAGTSLTVDIVEAPLPDAQWQTDVTFPDWRGSVSNTFAINNRLGFRFYHGQGTLWLSCDEDVDGFSLYVNGRSIDTSDLAAGGTYMMDISGLTVDGMNSIQLNGLEEGEVRVCIPYPTVLDGTPEEAGISGEALELIDAIISADIEQGFPSAQLAIVQGGRLIYENAWGNIQTYDEGGEPVEAAPVTADTLYDLASNTKMYSVNYALQYLLTQGDISLDMRITDILGDAFAEDTIDIAYEGYDHVSLETNRAWKASLTIRDLLMHQGGFPPGPNYFSDRYDCASQYFDSDNGNLLYVGTGADETAREETLRQIFRTPLMYEPGTQTMYSDVDYMVLCYCIEEITGERLDDFLRETFWEPMGLSHITYDPLENGFAPEDCAATELMGNTRDGQLHFSGIRTGLIQGEVHDSNAYYCMDGVSGHAGMFASASDLARLASVMLTGGYGEHRFFSRNVIDLFTSPQNENAPGYALGWWREADHGRDWYFGSVTGSDAFGHQGFTGTLTMIDPDHDLVIVLLTNKLHTPMLQGDETLSAWSGNYYTTGTLGFVAEIVEMGMEAEAANDEDGSIWEGLVRDMAADALRVIEAEGITDHDHPRWRAYEALISISP